MGIDIKSLVSSRLRMCFGDQELGLGTGFFYSEDGSFYLVTNWHNVTGRNPTDFKPIDKSGGIPNRIILSLNKKDQLGAWVEVAIPLYSDLENKHALWFVHPKWGQNVDIAIIPFAVPAEATIYPVNSKEVSKSPDMRISIAQDVFVLGYPRGLSGGGLFPIWKRATIATEPDVNVDDLPKMLIDTATREGMSGAPVFAKSDGMYRDSKGNSVLSPGGGICFVGIYSGRNIGQTEIEAQLGLVWKIYAIKEIIKAKQIGTSSFDL